MSEHEGAYGLMDSHYACRGVAEQFLNPRLIDVENAISQVRMWEPEAGQSCVREGSDRPCEWGRPLTSDVGEGLT